MDTTMVRPQLLVLAQISGRTFRGHRLNMRRFSPTQVAQPMKGLLAKELTNYYVGSPSSPLQNATTAPSNFGQWAAGAGSEQRPFDVKDWSVEHKKPSKELRAFDGDMANYDNWRNRVMDHFISVNCNYSIIFDILEKCKAPIAWSTLRATHIAAVPHMN